MTCQVGVQTSSGVRAAGLSGDHGPWVIIHVDAVDLSDEEIVRTFRECIDTAWYAEALDMADHLLLNSRGVRIPYIPEYAYRYKPVLERFADRDQSIRDALEIFAAVEQRAANRSASPAKRREIQSQYDRLFVAIGRRDGFHCAICRATTDLVIDHEIALINGGTNDLDNLQFLCGSCNSHKSDRK